MLERLLGPALSPTSLQYSGKEPESAVETHGKFQLTPFKRNAQTLLSTLHFLVLRAVEVFTIVRSWESSLYFFFYTASKFRYTAEKSRAPSLQL
jgi:hypothetical protein